jgi:WD40 repeat protein
VLVHPTALISASKDGSIALWDRETGRRTQELHGHEGAVTALALSPDGRSLLSGGHDGQLVHWTLADPQSPRVLAAHEAPITALAWAEDGTWFSAARDGEVRRWSEGQLMGTWTGHADRVRALHADLPRVLTASYDHTLRIWDARDSSVSATLVGHEGPVVAARLVGDMAVSASTDGTVRGWALDGEERWVNRDHDGAVAALVVLDPTTVLSGGNDGHLRAIDTGTGASTHLATLPHPLDALGHAEGWIVAGDRRGRVWLFR